MIHLAIAKIILGAATLFIVGLLVVGIYSLFQSKILTKVFVITTFFLLITYYLGSFLTTYL